MSMKALLATCVALSCVALVLAAPSCRFQFSNPTATFDLSGLKNPSATGYGCCNLAAHKLEADDRALGVWWVCVKQLVLRG